MSASFYLDLFDNTSLCVHIFSEPFTSIYQYNPFRPHIYSVSKYAIKHLYRLICDALLLDSVYNLYLLLSMCFENA